VAARARADVEQQAPVRAELRVSRTLAQADETDRCAALQAAQQGEQVAGQCGATVAELRRSDILDLPPAGHGAGVYGAELVRAGVERQTSSFKTGPHPHGFRRIGAEHISAVSLGQRLRERSIPC
jgi:hypothetical protein